MTDDYAGLRTDFIPIVYRAPRDYDGVVTALLLTVLGFCGVVSGLTVALALAS